MKELRLEYTDGEDFKLYIGSEYIGRKDSPKWYSPLTKDITIDGETYMVRPKSIWNSECELKLDGKIFFEVDSVNFRNKIVIKEDRTVVYVIKREEYFYEHDVLLVGEGGKELIRIQSKFNWREFGRNYTIALSPGFGDTDLEKVMIVLTMAYFDYLQDND